MQLGVGYLKLTTLSNSFTRYYITRSPRYIMSGNKFSFGSASRMKEVPAGEYAELKFSGKMENIETEWGEKCSFEVTLFSHPSYESIPKEGLETLWESKSSCATQLMSAASEGLPDLTKALKEKWKLIRTPEGTYFLEQL